MANLKLGELLVKARVLTESQLKAALAEQQRWGGRLGEIVVRMNLLTEDLLVRALSRQLNIPAVNLEAVNELSSELKGKIPLEKAREIPALAIELRDDGKTLLVAMSEPQNVEALDTLRALTRCRIVPRLAGQMQIARAIARCYEGEGEPELAEGEGSFKVLDSQGMTVRRPAPEPPAASPPPPPRFNPLPAAPKGDLLEVLGSVEEAQRKEVAALKAMVELLIEKGVFTRDEYLAKVKRP